MLALSGGPACSICRPMPQFAFEALGLAVRTHEDLPKCTVFVGVEINGKFHPVGTGFLVSIVHEGFVFYFLATADHVIDLVKADTFSIRMNRKSGDCSTVQIPKSQRFGLERAADIAMFSLEFDSSVFDQKFMLLDRSKYEETLKTIWDPHVGDEVSTVGLYTTHFGETKNLPVIRIGNIALMPGEPILTHRGYTSAYLIETRSIEGLSGSPVFANIPTVRAENGKLQYMKGLSAMPIGMLTGYHLVESANDQIRVPKVQGEPIDEDQEPSMDERNTGFGVVVPWTRFLEIAEDEITVGMMNEAIKERMSESGYRPAGLTAPADKSDEAESSEANPAHREDFVGLLNKAAKPPKAE